MLDFYSHWYMLLNDVLSYDWDGGQAMVGKEAVETMMERFDGIISQGDVKYSRICEPV